MASTKRTAVLVSSAGVAAAIGAVIGRYSIGGGDGPPPLHFADAAELSVDAEPSPSPVESPTDYPPGVSDLRTGVLDPEEQATSTVNLPTRWKLIPGSITTVIGGCIEVTRVDLTPEEGDQTKLEVRLRSRCQTPERFYATFRYTCDASDEWCPIK